MKVKEEQIRELELKVQVRRGQAVHHTRGHLRGPGPCSSVEQHLYTKGRGLNLVLFDTARF